MTGTGPLIKVNRALKSVQWVLTSKKRLWCLLPFMKLYTIFAFPTVTYNTVDRISFGIEHRDRRNTGHAKVAAYSAPGAVAGDRAWPRRIRRSGRGSREGEMPRSDLRGPRGVVTVHEREEEAGEPETLR